MKGVGWSHRVACATAGATVGLIVAGGLVTNTGAALAVPDWPTTFGHNPFLFPWSGMVGGVLVEHGHRLIGAAIGMLTVLLAAVLWRGDGRRWVRGLGLLAVGTVCVQGLIGGLRVVLLQDALAIVHGCLAQLFFALLVGIAVVTGRGWQDASIVPAEARRLASPRSAGGGRGLRPGGARRLHHARDGRVVARGRSGRGDGRPGRDGPRRPAGGP